MKPIKKKAPQKKKAKQKAKAVPGFPQPIRHNLTRDELLFYWARQLKPVHRGQCAVILYRMDPALAPFPTMAKANHDEYEDQSTLDLKAWIDLWIPRLSPDKDWLMEHPEIMRIVFCVRIQRTWKSEYGKRSEEVCVCTFEVER